jgi:hypothetical protein
MTQGHPNNGAALIIGAGDGIRTSPWPTSSDLKPV